MCYHDSFFKESTGNEDTSSAEEASSYASAKNGDVSSVSSSCLSGSDAENALPRKERTPKSVRRKAKHVRAFKKLETWSYSHVSDFTRKSSTEDVTELDSPAKQRGKKRLKKNRDIDCNSKVESNNVGDAPFIAHDMISPVVDANDPSYAFWADITKANSNVIEHQSVDQDEVFMDGNESAEMAIENRMQIMDGLIKPGTEMFFAGGNPHLYWLNTIDLYSTVLIKFDALYLKMVP